MTENPFAFPEAPADSNAYQGRSGMTLRDWFAGQVLGHALESARLYTGEVDASEAADWAYQVADAMLVARSAEHKAEPGPEASLPAARVDWTLRDPDCPDCKPAPDAKACPSCWIPF